MDPLDEAPQDRPTPSLPFGLRVFIVFASALCGGAGFALTLWALPSVAPKTMFSTVVHDTQEAVSTILNTSSPCDTSGTSGGGIPCTDTLKDKNETDSEDEVTLEGLLKDEADTVRVPVVTEEGEIVLNSKKTIVLERVSTEPVPQKQEQTVKQPTQKPAPKAQPKTQPAKVATTAPTEQPQQKTAPVQQPTPQPVQTIDAPTPMCTRIGSYLPASSLPLNPNGQAFQLTVDEPKYYTIYGKTAQEIRKQMAYCTPVEGGYDAATHWWYRYSYNYFEIEGGQCAIKDVKIALHITFLFPAWQDSGSNPQLTSHFNQYYQSLVTHEHGHRDITIQYAQQALAAVEALPPSPCNSIVQTVNAYADAKLQVIQQKNSAYDSETGHGASQGAIFP